MTLRHLIAALLVCTAISIGTAPAQTTVNYTLYMRNVSSLAMWDGSTLPTFGFAANLANAPVPAPTLYCNEGDTINLYTRNISQGLPHTIHPHGMDVPQAWDGVEMTSFSLMHMQDTNYIWVAAHAGTFLYHCHMASIVHVQMGMYGCIVVKAAGGALTAYTGGPAFTKEKLWIMSEMDSEWHLTLPAADSLHDSFPVPDYVPDYFLVNGLSRQQLQDSAVALTAMVGDKLYLRLANLGYFENRLTFPAHLNATVLTSDGRPLPAPIRTDTLQILSGERYEVLLTPTIETLADIEIAYIDPFTDSTWDAESAPITIAGVIGIPEGIEQKTALTLYPNPASNTLFVQLPEGAHGPVPCRIVDILGNTVQEFAILPGHPPIAVDIAGLPSGIYSVQAATRKGSVTQKMTINR